MTFAELALLAGGVIVLYLLLGPLQRWLERIIARGLSLRRPRVYRTTIDVADFRSHSSHREEDKEEDHDQQGS